MQSKTVSLRFSFTDFWDDHQLKYQEGNYYIDGVLFPLIKFEDFDPFMIAALEDVAGEGETPSADDILFISFEYTLKEKYPSIGDYIYDSPGRCVFFEELTILLRDNSPLVREGDFFEFEEESVILSRNGQQKREYLSSTMGFNGPDLQAKIRALLE